MRMPAWRTAGTVFRGTETHSEVLVVLHLGVRDADALLEGDGIVILASIDGLRHAAVGAVGADHGVHLQRLGHAHLRRTAASAPRRRIRHGLLAQA